MRVDLLLIFLILLFLVCKACLETCCEDLPPRAPLNYTFYQNTGHFLGGKGEFFIDTYGYSGNATGRNNPEMQCVRMIGPAPATEYVIEYCKNWMHNTSFNRPCSFSLKPLEEEEMCGRNAFFIHGCQCCTEGDLTAPPIDGCSAGCIVVPIYERMKLRVGDYITVKNYEQIDDDKEEFF